MLYALSCNCSLVVICLLQKCKVHVLLSCAVPLCLIALPRFFLIPHLFTSLLSFTVLSTHFDPVLSSVRREARVSQQMILF